MTGALLSSLISRPGVKALLVTVLAVAAFAMAPAAIAEPIRGAGSTFAAPIIHQWSRDYEAARADGGDFASPDWQVDYEPVGSLAGIMRLSQPDMDFAATDAPLPAQEVERQGLTQFPIVMGGIAVVANIEGVGAGQLRLTGPVLADIYLGKISNWSDPMIKELNPDASLPDAAIEVLHREDGSGSTLTFTSYLSSTSPEWKEKLGADTLIKWPLGRAEKGTGGLAALAAATRNSIAYLEYGQVVRAGLPFVALQNASGSFVRPERAAFEAGLGAIFRDAKGGFQAAPGATLANAYPMSVITYAIVPRDRGQHRINRVLDLFRLAFSGGADEATALGYVPITPELAGQIETYWAESFGQLNN